MKRYYLFIDPLFRSTHEARKNLKGREPDGLLVRTPEGGLQESIAQHQEHPWKYIRLAEKVLLIFFLK